MKIDARTRHVIESALVAGWATQECGELLDDERVAMADAIMAIDFDVVGEGPRGEWLYANEPSAAPAQKEKMPK